MAGAKVESERINERRIEEGRARRDQAAPQPDIAEPKPRSTTAGFFLFCGVEGDAGLLFQDKLFKRACIHRSNCSVRKGAISPGPEGTWHGAYTTYEEARRTAAELSPKKGAQLGVRQVLGQNADEVKQFEIIAALTEGTGTRATARITGVNRETVGTLALRVASVD